MSLQKRRAVEKHPLLFNIPSLARGAVTSLLAVMLRNALVYRCAASQSSFLPTGSGPAFQLSRLVLSSGKGPPASLAPSDLAGDMELLAATEPEGAERNATASRAEVERVERAAATGEAESPEEACPGGKVVTPEQAAAIVVETSENQEAGGDAELFARAAERIAISEVAKVLQSAIAEVGTTAALG